MATQPIFEDRFNRILDENVEDTLEWGTFYGAVFGISGAILMVILQLLGMPARFEVPATWAFLCGIYCLTIGWLLRHWGLGGTGRAAAALGFVSLPLVIFLISHFTLPAGAATYFTGPPSYLYFFLIIMTGFFFHRRLAVAAGILAGVQFFCVFLLARGFLQSIPCGDALFAEDLSSVPINFFKALLMAFTGGLVGVMVDNTHTLIAELQKEEREKQMIDRLFGTYVSAEVKDKIMASRLDRIAESKRLVILFSDIRSFSTMSEASQPETIVTQLNEYFEAMVACINREGGVIDKFIGDAVMATFGGVLELPNPCDAGLRAALAMQHALLGLNESWRQRDFPPWKTGIGLHFGRVIQGTIGSSNRKEFTVIGDAVNTASRLESITKEQGCPIILSADCQASLSPDMQGLLEDLGEVALKGKTQAVKIFGIRPPVASAFTEAENGATA